MTQTFNKRPFTPKEQIQHLERRNLRFSNKKEAENHLQYIGYYRLKGYFAPFKSLATHAETFQFEHGTKFQHILDLYTFDRQLRLILLDALERIEVAVRSVMTNVMAERYGAHWFLERVPFKQGAWERAMEKIHRSQKNRIVSGYKQKFDAPDLPPSWATMEVLSFGSLSILFQWLHFKEQKIIASKFSIPHRVLASWLHSLSILRNTCAHHSRTWNHTFQRLAIPKNSNVGIQDAFRLQDLICAIHFLLKNISKSRTWVKKLNKHLETCPRSLSHMGFAQQKA